MNHIFHAPNGHLAQYILDQFPEGYRGYGVDVGASDGISINTTFHLERVHRWHILSVEANPDFASMLKEQRAFVEMCACSDQPGEADFHIHKENPESFSALRVAAPRPDVWPNEPLTWKVVKVHVRTLEQLLEKWDFPRLDLLCIDTEGTELDVLRGCDLSKWKPKVVVTECWDKVGPIDLFLGNLGYVKTARSVHNDIFILREEA